MEEMTQFSNGLKMETLGGRIRDKRQRLRLSLEALSQRSGVSRSMLSDLENGNKVPSVLTLDHIATALGTSIAALLEEGRPVTVQLLRHQDQQVVRDASGWERRILSPVLPGVEFEFMRTVILPGVDAGVFSPHATGSREYLAIEQGELHLTLDGVDYFLGAGDSIYYSGDCYHGFTNSGNQDCVYYLAMELSPSRSYH